MPAVGLIGVGSRGWIVPLPVPLVLAWPLVGIALAVTALATAIDRRSGRHPRSLVIAHAALLAFCRVHGLKVDVRSRAGKRVLLWFV